MKTIEPSKSHFFAFLLVGIFIIAGCGSDDPNAPRATYEVTVFNLSDGQPLSPIAVILHKTGYMGWRLGEAVSDGLEELAEGGDPTAFLAEAAADDDVRATAAGAGIIVPGGNETVTLTFRHSVNFLMTVASMLVNTNDAFWGIDSMPVGNLAAGEEATFYPFTYDAGTEVNSESAASIPGPAGGGEGFNAERVDSGYLSVHRGVVTSDDGLATSALDESHRFLGSVCKIVISRTK